jgi:hypothetical protein
MIFSISDPSLHLLLNPSFENILSYLTAQNKDETQHSFEIRQCDAGIHMGYDCLGRIEIILDVEKYRLDRSIVQPVVIALTIEDDG